MELSATSLMSPASSAFDLTSDVGTSIATGRSRDVSFSSVLSRFGQGMNDLDPETRARVAAEEFVAGSLILPILKEMRAMNNAWGPFAPGRHEETFGAMLDGEVASKIVRASNFPLVDRLARDLLLAERRMSGQSKDGTAGAFDEEA